MTSRTFKGCRVVEEDEGRAFTCAGLRDTCRPAQGAPSGQPWQLSPSLVVSSSHTVLHSDGPDETFYTRVCLEAYVI